MHETGVTVFICTSCKSTVDPGSSPGRAMIDAVEARLGDNVCPGFSVKGIECLAVCKRPCTIALAGIGKWTFVVGDLNAADHANDLVAMSLKYAASEDGIVPWRERPHIFRKGIISRVPPLPVSTVE